MNEHCLGGGGAGMIAGGAMRRIGLCFISIAALAGTAAAENAQVGAQKPMIEPWGYPLAALDRTVKPGDDFYAFANGGWLKATEIPADRTGVGFSTDMRDRNDDRIAAIISHLAGAKVRVDTNEQRIRDLYQSFVDVETVETRGLKPLEKDFARIAAASTHEEIAALMGDPALALDGPFHARVEIDSRNPSRYAVWIGHSGLSLPDKSYYELETERLVEVRALFKQHIARMLALAGVAGDGAAVYELERRIASLHWDIEARRDALATYNPMDAEALKAFAPGFPWISYFKAQRSDRERAFIIQEKSAFPELAALFAETPVDTWRAYLAFRLIDSFSAFLPKEIDAGNFSFFGAVVNGQAEQRPRERRAIELVNDDLDQAVGEIYIAAYFPLESKTLVRAMFEDFRAALGERIGQLSWMTPETKTAALEKLAQMDAKIAYPDKWRSWRGLKIMPGDLVGNIKRIRKFDAAYEAGLLRRPVDKREWFAGPQTVNAFYSPERNEIFVPAGYIQPPLFDPHADPAINYGAIGSIIGHEIGHGFDDQGSKYDGKGALADWWTGEDRAAFDKLGDRFAEQFDAYEPLPGLHVNGRLTLGENIGDLAGVVLALHAYEKSLDGAAAPVLDGFTGAQRVFLGRAQARRFKQTEDALRRRLLSDPHSPMDLRVNGMVRNIDEWYDAFGVEEGDAMFLEPEARVYIW